MSSRRPKTSMKAWRTMGFVITSGVLLLAFNNCSKPIFAEEPSTLVVTSESTPTEVIIQNCINAEQRGKLQTRTKQIVFADTRLESGRTHVCDWTRADNLPMSEGINTAQYVQKRSLDLPARAVVCDVQMQIDTQTVTYDDVFVLTYNDRIIASNDRTAVVNFLSPEMTLATSSNLAVDLYKYDWMKFRGSPFQNDDYDDYCLGKEQGLSQCQWPLTQQTGNFVFQFSPELLIDIGKRAPASDQNIGLMVTGDNDPSSDCYHSPIQFNVQVDYYLPE